MEVKSEVVAGRKLASKDLNGLSDPYCEVAVKEQQFKTKIVKKSLNPTWGDEYYL